MNDYFFIERYKLLSNEELLEILEQPEDYQAEAILAAKQEFQNRKLSELELSLLKINSLSAHLQRLERNAQSIDKRIFGWIAGCIKAINPFTKNGVNKQIAWVAVAMTAYLIINLFMAITAIAYSIGRPILPNVWHLIRLGRFVILPLAIILITKNKSQVGCFSVGILLIVA